MKISGICAGTIACALAHRAAGPRAATERGWKGYRRRPYEDSVYHRGPQKIPGGSRLSIKLAG
jgi:hypothetical protein